MQLENNIQAKITCRIRISSKPQHHKKKIRWNNSKFITLQQFIPTYMANRRSD
jgi:hypothetical protein